MEPVRTEAAFPTVESITETAWDTDPTSHPCDLPATVNSGDLLLTFIAIEESDLTGIPSGWTELSEIEQSGAFIWGGVYARDADGTEDSGTVDFATTSGFNGTCQVWRITGWAGTIATDIDVATPAQTTGTATFSSGAVTAGWGSNDNLFITIAAIGDDASTTTGYPTNYNDNQTSTACGAGCGTNDTARVSTASRNLASNTDNAGNFTVSENEAWSTHAVVIEPSAAGGGSTGIGVHNNVTYNNVTLK